MKTVVVLFNLKAGVDAGAYEAWAKTADLPTVNGLASVERFEVLKSAGLLGADGASPWQYIELIRVHDMDAFFGDLGRPEVQAGAAAFGEFADNPLFIVTDAL